MGNNQYIRIYANDVVVKTFDGDKNTIDFILDKFGVGLLESIIEAKPIKEVDVSLQNLCWLVEHRIFENIKSEIPEYNNEAITRIKIELMEKADNITGISLGFFHIPVRVISRTMLADNVCNVDLPEVTDADNPIVGNYKLRNGINVNLYAKGDEVNGEQ